MNWETFDWNSMWLGFTAGTWVCLGINELGEKIRKGKK